MTTHWSLVAAAGGPDDTVARDALATLCGFYWHPLYAFVRRSGYDADDAADLTQGFFARLLEKNNLAAADPCRGRFRTWLLAAMKHFLSNERDRRLAKKAGGGRLVSFDRADAENLYRLEASHQMTPDRIFNHRWARTLLDQVLTALWEECRKGGKTLLFESLKPFIAGAPDDQSYRQIGRKLGMTEGAVKVSAHRLRRRYRQILRDLIALTVEGDTTVDDEIKELFVALGQG